MQDASREECSGSASMTEEAALADNDTTSGSCRRTSQRSKRIKKSVVNYAHLCGLDDSDVGTCRTASAAESADDEPDQRNSVSSPALASEPLTADDDDAAPPDTAAQRGPKTSHGRSASTKRDARRQSRKNARTTPVQSQEPDQWALETGLTVLVAKVLTPSDANSGRIILPRTMVEANLNFVMGYRAYTLNAIDDADKLHEFVIKAWANGTDRGSGDRRVYVMEQAAPFIKGHGLGQGDAIALCINVAGTFVMLANTPQVQAATIKTPAAGAAALRAAAGPAPPGSIPLMPHTGSACNSTCSRTDGCTKADSHSGFCSRSTPKFVRSERDRSASTGPTGTAASQSGGTTSVGERRSSRSAAVALQWHSQHPTGAPQDLPRRPRSNRCLKPTLKAQIVKAAAEEHEDSLAAHVLMSLLGGGTFNSDGEVEDPDYSPQKFGRPAYSAESEPVAAVSSCSAAGEPPAKRRAISAEPQTNSAPQLQECTGSKATDLPPWHQPPLPLPAVGEDCDFHATPTGISTLTIANRQACLGATTAVPPPSDLDTQIPQAVLRPADPACLVSQALNAAIGLASSDYEATSELDSTCDDTSAAKVPPSHATATISYSPSCSSVNPSAVCPVMQSPEFATPAAAEVLAADFMHAAAAVAEAAKAATIAATAVRRAQKSRAGSKRRPRAPPPVLSPLMRRSLSLPRNGSSDRSMRRASQELLKLSPTAWGRRPTAPCPLPSKGKAPTQKPPADEASSGFCGDRLPPVLMPPVSGLSALQPKAEPAAAMPLRSSEPVPQGALSSAYWPMSAEQQSAPPTHSQVNVPQQKWHSELSIAQTAPPPSTPLGIGAPPWLSAMGRPAFTSSQQQQQPHLAPQQNMSQQQQQQRRLWETLASSQAAEMAASGAPANPFLFRHPASQSASSFGLRTAGVPLGMPCAYPASSGVHGEAASLASIINPWRTPQNLTFSAPNPQIPLAPLQLLLRPSSAHGPPHVHGPATPPANLAN